MICKINEYWSHIQSAVNVQFKPIKVIQPWNLSTVPKTLYRIIYYQAHRVLRKYLLYYPQGLCGKRSFIRDEKKCWPYCTPLREPCHWLFIMNSLVAEDKKYRRHFKVKHKRIIMVSSLLWSDVEENVLNVHYYYY